MTQLALQNLLHYRRTHAAVAFGVACAVAVLAGALLIGESVRESLSALAVGRLGRTDVVVAAETPFTESLGNRLLAEPTVAALFADAVPLITLEGAVVHQSSSRRAERVRVYGVDSRFFSFHRVDALTPESSDVVFSPDLAAELGASTSDVVLIRVARPTDIPLDSLHGRKEDAGRSLRLSYRGPLGREAMGEFSLAPGQGPVRAAFVALSRLERDLGLTSRVNTLLLAAKPGAPADAAVVRAALGRVLDSADLGLRVQVLALASSVLVETAAGMLSNEVAQAAEAAARRERLRGTPILTWLANRLTVSNRTVPYSLVTAIGPDAAGDSTLARLLKDGDSPDGPPIVLNDWAARDLRAAPGDRLQLEYFRWADEGRLVTERASFWVSGVVPIEGLARDRRLAPDYPGITDTDSLTAWDPPFPIDLTLVRPRDDDYWAKFRTTPKAFIPLATGQRLWRNRHGQLTSLRLAPAAASTDLDAAATRVKDAIARSVDPADAGFRVIGARSQALASSVGATDFGAYFSYFSFFLVLSALLLTLLFFRLSVEQRLAEIGLLRAAGFSLAAVRRLFVIEGAIVAVAGAALGVCLAIGWAALMMYGLRTWWVDAVGTTLLELHVDGLALAIGAVAGVAAAVLSMAVSIGRLSRATPRALLTGAHDLAGAGASPRAGVMALVGAGAAAALSLASALGLVPSAGGFFGAGALVLAAGIAAFRWWLGKRPRRSFFEERKTTSEVVFRLGVTNAGWRPGRSLTSAGLVAAAVFLLVSVDAFRKTAGASGEAEPGTGGFELLGESTLPIVHDPSTPAGRDALGLIAGTSEPSLDGVSIVPARLRPGDDTSCLNLYQPKQPRVLGVSNRLAEIARFRFSASVAASDAERENPWRLLGPAGADGIVPAIADATSLQYVLHASVGDVITIDADTARPIRLRVVAALDDSMLQGELLIADRAFLDLFPNVAGYRVLFIDVVPPVPDRIDAVGRFLEERLEPLGVDVEDSVRRLEAYHRVENTYLSTFQALGGLGLVLGSLGLAAIIARNVLERRRELALLGAAGFTGRHLQLLVVAEQLAVVGAGLAIGMTAALVAVLPVLLTRGGWPTLPLVWLGAVVLAGLVSAMGATRSVRRMALVPSLRSE